MTPISTRAPALAGTNGHRHRVTLHDTPDSETERMEHRRIRKCRRGEHDPRSSGTTPNPTFTCRTKLVMVSSVSLASCTAWTILCIQP
ncbi:hypothetical protein HMPREF9612_01234 [Cutibacterium acnes HL063PA2]|nr:hypothetical protein HMPREF9612_01234 [Cutibacterium acnes HL063PA2]EFT54462.1 hypothetical protein HMPREF9610_02419 [Cutibacterium acnes HL027PA2]